jgi:hypothetical protein
MMGIETALLSLAVGAAGTVASVVQARKAAKAQKEAQAISTASGQIQDTYARRKAARESRIRRARLIQASSNTGTEGSSGELGAGSGLTSGFGSSVAQQTAGQITVEGISAANQRIQNAEGSINAIGSFTKLAQGGLSLYDDNKDMFSFGK